MINKKRLISTFIKLVKIDSPSGHEQKVAKFVSQKLKSFGAQTEFDHYGNVIAKFDGVGVPIMLNSHLDTVEPGRNVKPKVLTDRIVSDQTTILGADAKSGVAIILEALESLKEDKKSHVPMDVVFTLEEETGLFGAFNLDYKKLRAKYGVTFDGHGNLENVTTSAPGYTKFDATIIGRGAHSGFEPEKGLSAIRIASEIILKLKEGRIDSETTANVGLIEGGSVRNAVAEFAHIKAEIRSRSHQKLDKHTKHFEKVFSEVLSRYPDAKLKLDIKKVFNPYVFKENHEVIKRVVDGMGKIGIKPVLEPSGGATDVNIFNENGVKVVCVGAGYFNPHTLREYVMISEMLNGAKFCEELVTV